MEQGSRNKRRSFLAGVALAGAAGVTSSASASTNSQVNKNSLKRSKAANVGSTPLSGTDNAITPPFSVMVLNRLGFGPRRTKVSKAAANPDVLFDSSFEVSQALGQDDVEYFESLGTTDAQRLENWLDEQLTNSLPDQELDQRLDLDNPNSPYYTLSQSLAGVFSTRECQGSSEYRRPLRDVEFAAFMRACYSRNQLFELMVDFWHNHFNVYGEQDRDTSVAFAAWDRDVIRRETFGNFYSMLHRSARHPVMLRYLDNYENRAGGINENYARELFELHGLGSENYQGVDRPRDVAGLSENPYTAVNDAELNNPAYGYIADPSLVIAEAYVDDDVYSAAEALTGWRYDDENVGNSCGTGAFFTEEEEHSGNIAKAVLTQGVAVIPSDLDAATEGRLVIKMVAYHPGTAVHISRKICRRLCMDDPPEPMVQAGAQAFFANRRAPDQIAKTIKAIVMTPEFMDINNWGSKMKRPFEHIVSVMRCTGFDRNLNEDDRDSRDFRWQFQRAGQRLFTWRTPDGFPDRREHWEGSTSLVHMWRTVDWLIDENASDNDRLLRVINITLENLSGNPTPRQIVEFWCNWMMGFSPQGGWAGGPGTLFSNAPTELGKACMQFFTQQGFPVGEEDASIWPADQQIARAELGVDDWPYYWHRRLRGLITLISWSPNFMQR